MFEKPAPRDKAEAHHERCYAERDREKRLFLISVELPFHPPTRLVHSGALINFEAAARVPRDGTSKLLVYDWGRHG